MATSRRCFLSTSEKAATGGGRVKNAIKGTKPSLAANKNGQLVCAYNGIKIINPSIHYGIGEI